MNWLSLSVGKLGVMREMCRALQKDVNVWTERLSYRPKMAKTPREYWEQTAEGNKNIKLNSDHKYEGCGNGKGGENNKISRCM